MANTGFKGLDERQTGNRLVFRSLLVDTNGNPLTTGTTSLYLYELQSDGTYKSYDFSTNTFVATTLTTETLSLTHQTGNNGATNTGVWTGVLTTLTGFTAGAVYLAQVRNTSAASPLQAREFQYGGGPGDVVVTAGATGVGYPQTDVTRIKTQAVTCAAPVTVSASVGTASPSTAQTGDAFARLGAPAGASVSADIAGVVASQATYNKLLGTGHVSAVTSNGNFSVVFDAAYEGDQTALADGTLYLSFTSGLNQWHSSKVTGATLTDNTHATLTFATSFGRTVSVNDTFAIVTN